MAVGIYFHHQRDILTKYYDNTGVNIAGNLASITDIVQRFNIELSDDFETSKKIYLKEADSGKYVGYASKDFVLSETKVVEDYYTISIDDNNNLILTTAQGYVVCYNPSSPRFKPYDRSFMESTNGFIQLYVKQEIKPEKVSPKLSWSENISLIELRLGTQSTYTNKCLTPTGLTPEYSSSNSALGGVNQTLMRIHNEFGMYSAKLQGGQQGIDLSVIYSRFK